jgi:hypothetical protein
MLYAPTRVSSSYKTPYSHQDLGLSQPHHNPEHQEGNVHTLCGVKNYGHPRTPSASSERVVCNGL